MFRRLNRCLIVMSTMILVGCATTEPGPVFQEPAEPPKPEWNDVTCRTTNWYELGRSQGQNGHVDIKIEDIADECVEQGVNINTADYLRGLETQAKHYCTPHQGQFMGSQGQAYPNLCQPEIYSEFYFEWYRSLRQYCHTQSVTTLMSPAVCHEIKS